MPRIRREPLPRATVLKPRRYNGQVIPHPNAPEPPRAPLKDHQVAVESELEREEAKDLQRAREGAEGTPGRQVGGPEMGLAVDSEPGSPPTVLSSDDMLFIWRLHQKKLSTRAIARLLSTRSKDVSPATINRFIRRCHDRPEQVQVALKSLRGEAVDSWREAIRVAGARGAHQPAKDLLIATGTIRNDQPMERVVIIVGDGRQAVAQLPEAPDVLPGEVIDIKAEPVPE